MHAQYCELPDYGTRSSSYRRLYQEADHRYVSHDAVRAIRARPGNHRHAHTVRDSRTHAYDREHIYGRSRSCARSAISGTRFGRRTFLAVCLLVFLALAYVLTTTVLPPSLESLSGIRQSRFASAAGISSRTGDLSDAHISGESVSVNAITDTGILHLINGSHAVVDEPPYESLSEVRMLVANGIGFDVLRKETLNATYELFTAARDAGIEGLYVSSGFRDHAQQHMIYEQASDKSIVQPAGHSEHQSGLAVDIMVYDIELADMARSKQGTWLAENAWKSGLILRYGADKQAVTGIGHEPWHFRYVGKPHAWYMYENNLSFEEYLTFLEDQGGYHVTLEGIDYLVDYQGAAEGMLQVPTHLCYEVSSDNRGGYIVTQF